MKTSLKRIIAMVLCLAMTITMLPLDMFSASTAYAADPANLIQNPGFESGMTGWSTYKEGTYTVDTSKKYDGSASLKISNNGTSKIANIKQTVAVTAGSTYDISAYLATDNDSVKPFYNIVWYNGADTEISRSIVNSDVWTSEFSLFTTTLKAPANASSMLVEFNVRNVVSDVWVDAFSVVEVEDDNLVANGSFEENSLNGWTTYKAGTYSVDYSKKYHGAASLKMITDSTKIANVKQYVPIEAGKTYDVSVFYTCDKTTAAPFINLMWYKDGSVMGDASQIASASYGATWTEMKSTVKAPAGATHLYVEVNLRNLINATMWVDSVSVVESDSIVNLLNDPSFEMNNGWWNFVVAAANADVIQDTTVSHTGNASAKFSYFSPTLTAGRAYVQQKLYNLESETPYRFVAWYRSEDLADPASVTFRWVTHSGEGEKTEQLKGESGTHGWKRMVVEVVSPKDVQMLALYPDLRSLKGTLWYDDLLFHQITVDDMPGEAHAYTDAGFENAGADSVWSLQTKKNGTAEFDTSVKKNGSQSLRLTTTSAKDEASARQLNVSVPAGMSCILNVNYKTENVEGFPYIKIMWYDENGKFLSSSVSDVEPSTTWATASVQGAVPELATQAAVVLGMAEGAGTVWFDDAELSTLLFNVHGDPVYVSNVVNIMESFYEPGDSNPDNDDPEKFWEMIPEAELNEPDNVMWAERFFRHSYFSVTDGEAGGFRFTLPEEIIERDRTIPRVTGVLGKPVEYGPALAIAVDIEFNPFVLGHAQYSDRYYHRTEAHYLRTDYCPSYVLSGNEYFKERGLELLGFMEFTQWHADGSNDFVEKYYGTGTGADAYELHPEYRGGWDYCFDWLWTDAYGYTWKYHEPDHHVGSLMALEIINAYEVFDLDEKYLDMVREFLYYQIPRYGFHTGEWNGHKYYWTEYNPTGKSVGNPSLDATDNIQALVAAACAMAAYYEEDPVMKARYLEFSRGLVWYLVREHEIDGKYYYDGAENPINYRKAVSHDNATVYYSWRALAYLYKCGVDVDAYLPYYDKINIEYNLTNGGFQRKRYVQVAKVYDGVPEYGNTLKYTSFINVTTQDIENARFSDTIPEYGFEIPTTLNVRISHILPPTKSYDNWTIDPAQDVVFTVTPDQLSEGINIPWTLKYAEAYRVTYELNVINDARFNREDVVDTESAISAWTINAANNNNEAVYVKATSFTSALGAGHGSFTEPVAHHINIDSDNFLSYAARLQFPFEREVNSILVDSAAPLAQSYVGYDNWSGIGADSYVYVQNSVYGDLIHADAGASTVTQQSTGRMIRFSRPGQYVEWYINVPDTNEYEVIGSYMLCNYRGIIQMYIDDVEVGEPYDQFYNDTDVYPDIRDVSLGTVTLEKGWHKLKLETIGKNKLSDGYEAGIWHVLVLNPVGEPQSEYAPANPDQFVIAEHDRVMRSTKTKLRLDTYIESDNIYIYPITWISSNPEVATVDERGYVTAVANGKTTISAITSDGSFADSINITVNLKEEEVKPGFSDVSSFAPLFSDVDSTNRYFDDIVYVSSTGLMNGTGNNKFSPDATITRGMIVTILYRLAGQPSYAQGTKFSDVADNAWYASAAKWGSANGIVEGFPNGTFKPNDAITREQLAAIMYRYAVNCGLATKGTANANLNGYADASSVSEYARVALNWALTNGVMETYANGAIAPKTNASRGEVARVFHNIGTLLDR